MNNLVLEAIPADLYVSFHASVDMLSAIRGVKAFFLDYDDECCGRTSLLWFIKEQKATFGFIVITSYSIHYTKLYDAK